MSHMQACRKIHDRCDCNALELSEELNELKAAFGRELQQALKRIANLEAEKALAVAAERERIRARILFRNSRFWASYELAADVCGTEDQR